MNLLDAQAVVRPHFVLIETPFCRGTGFLFARVSQQSSPVVATAAHVVAKAIQSDTVIRIHAPDCHSTVFLESYDRVIELDRYTDSALLLLPESELDLPAHPLPTKSLPEALAEHLTVGWYGFPVFSPEADPHLFMGKVCDALPSRAAVMVDGVITAGIGGAPVFHTSSSGEVYLVGLATRPKLQRAGREEEPSLLAVQDLGPLSSMITGF